MFSENKYSPNCSWSTNAEVGHYQQLLTALARCRRNQMAWSKTLQVLGIRHLPSPRTNLCLSTAIPTRSRLTQMKNQGTARERRSQTQTRNSTFSRNRPSFNLRPILLKLRILLRILQARRTIVLSQLHQKTCCPSLSPSLSRHLSILHPPTQILHRRSLAHRRQLTPIR